MATKRISQLAQTATEADLKAGNYFALDGAEGTKRLPAEAVAKAADVNELENIVKYKDVEENFITGKQVDSSGNYIADSSQYYRTQLVYLNGLKKVILKHYWSNASKPTIAFYGSSNFTAISKSINPSSGEFNVPDGATRFVVQTISTYPTEIYLEDFVAKKSDLANYSWAKVSFNVHNYNLTAAAFEPTPQANRLLSVNAVYVGKNNRFKVHYSGNLQILINYFKHGYYGETRTGVTDTWKNVEPEYVAMDDFATIGFRKSDNSNVLPSDVSDTYIEIFGYNEESYKSKKESIGQSANVITIAAADTDEDKKLIADVVCDGEHDEVEINSAVENSHGYNTTIRLLPGTYKIDAFISRDDGASPCVVRLPSNRQNCVTLECNESHVIRKGGSNNMLGGAIFDISQDCYNSLDSDTQYSVIRSGAVNGGIPKLDGVANVNRLVVKGISFRLPDNQKKIICIDGFYSASMEVDFCMGSARFSRTEFHKPVEGCIGIRGLQGSTYGMGNKWSRCMFWAFHTAYAVAGEHLIIEDCSSIYSYYGYTFNNFSKTSGWWGHPITLINCCDENSDNFPYFATQPTNVYDVRQCVDFISFNMEIISKPITSEERVLATEGTPGQWYGTINYTIQDSTGRNLVGQKFWADGSGAGFQSHNGAHKSVVSTSERKSYAPNYGQIVYDASLVKTVICTNPATKQWRNMDGGVIVDD